jgi:hypothetical protein
MGRGEPWDPKPPSLATRLLWWLDDRAERIRGSRDAKVIAGLLLVGLLVLGGFAAREVVGAQASTSAQRLVRLTPTEQQLEKVRVHAHVVTRWRVRRRVLYARPQTVLRTETIHTAHGTRVVTRRVTHYHVVYRKQVVTQNGRTQTVSQPVTTVQTRTETVRVTRPVTETQVRTTTVPVTTTVIATVTLPGTTVTVTLPVAVGG